VGPIWFISNPVDTQFMPQTSSTLWMVPLVCHSQQAPPFKHNLITFHSYNLTKNCKNILKAMLDAWRATLIDQIISHLYVEDVDDELLMYSFLKQM